jgi:hypothetical protein
MRWADIIKQYDHVKLKAILGGRFVLGYPPAVGKVDLIRPEDARYLSDDFLIAEVDGEEPSRWTLAIRGVRTYNIYQLPCNQRVLLDDWIVDLNQPKEIFKSPTSMINGTVADKENTVFIYHDYCCGVCFGTSGLLWIWHLFEGCLDAIELHDEVVVCKSEMYWEGVARPAEIHVNKLTGAIVGGDQKWIDFYLENQSGAMQTTLQ